ncbi:MAG: MarR family winged helix-turn-helix transcriptional regulator [Solirubrobacterales bacterium]
MTRKTKSDLIGELAYFVRASQTATDKMDEAGGKALGINRTDGRCMDIVQREGRMTAGRLAEEAGLTTGALTAVVDRLEKRGYLRRVADPEDRRRVLIDLTERAQRRTMELWGPLGEKGYPILAKWSVAELEAVLRFLKLSTDLNEERAAQIRAELGLTPAAAEGASSQPRDRVPPAGANADRWGHLAS